VRCRAAIEYGRIDEILMPQLLAAWMNKGRLQVRIACGE
jgi:hypothetical protein